MLSPILQVFVWRIVLDAFKINLQYNPKPEVLPYYFAFSFTFRQSKKPAMFPQNQ